MATRSDIQAFLSAFNKKMEEFDVVFLNTNENLHGLIELEMTRTGRKEILKDLNVEDYCCGPTRNVDNRADFWEFGRLVNQKKACIRMTIGMINKPVVCISFHLFGRQLNTPIINDYEKSIH